MRDTPRPAASSEPSAFRRDRFTWLAYGATAYGVYASAVLGPVMPFLRDELDISYTMAGLHFTLLAAGTTVAGASMDRVMNRFGRRAVVWVFGAVLAAAALLLVASRHPAGTIASSFFIGLAGAALLAATQSALAIRHGSQRTVAFAEASVVASVSFLIAPLLIGSLDGAGLDWRFAFMIPAVVWPVVYLTQRSVVFPASPVPTPQGGESGRRLPAAYWAYWTAVLLSVAVEWTFVAWGTSYIIERTGVGEGSAALVMTWFFIAMLTGRFAGSRLVRRVAPVGLILGALGVGVAGFFVWWLGDTVPVMAAGAFVAGLGIAGLYPVLAALAVGTAPDRTDLASSRVMLTAGVALLIAPQALAVVADSADLAAAYSLTLVGFGLLAVTTVVGARLERRSRATRGEVGRQS